MYVVLTSPAVASSTVAAAPAAAVSPASTHPVAQRPAHQQPRPESGPRAAGETKLPRFYSPSAVRVYSKWKTTGNSEDTLLFIIHGNRDLVVYLW
jgi:predicted esterase